MAASPSQLPRSMSLDSDEEEILKEILPLSLGSYVNLYLKITKTVALQARGRSTVKHIKALIQDKEHIDEQSQQLFYGGDCLEDGKRLADYGIHGDSTLHLILRDSARIRVNVEISSTQKKLTVEARPADTVRNVKLMIQAEEGVRPDEFALVFGGKVLVEDRTLASLDLPPEPTFHLVFHPRDDVSIVVKKYDHNVTLGAKSWYTVCDVKAIAEALMPVQVMSYDMVYQGKPLEDHKTLAYYNITDGSVLQLESGESFGVTWPFSVYPASV